MITQLSKTIASLYQSPEPMTARELSVKTNTTVERVYPTINVIKPAVNKVKRDGQVAYSLKDEARSAYEKITDLGMDMTAKDFVSMAQDIKRTVPRGISMGEVETVKQATPDNVLTSYDPAVDDAVDALSKLARNNERYRQALLKIKVIIEETFEK